MPRKRIRETNKGKWTLENLEQAASAVRDGLSIRKAAKQFAIPTTTLRDRLQKGTAFTGPRMGRKAVFTGDQEKELAEILKSVAEQFCGLTRKQICSAAYEFAEKYNIPHTFNGEKKCAGIEWYRSFIKRNPSISVKKTEATTANNCSPPRITKDDAAVCFGDLETVIEKHKFTASRIFNVDETAIGVVNGCATITPEKVHKQINSQTRTIGNEISKYVSVVCAMNACGNFIPPMFIFPRLRMSPLLSNGGPPEAIYRCSKDGLINASLFLGWLEHFKKHTRCTKDDPVLLVLDNDESHISLETHQFCQANGIVMFSLPPGLASYDLQPLNASFFGPLKIEFSKQCDMFMQKKDVNKITLYDLVAIFNIAYSSVGSIQTAVSGFTVTGIYPVTRDRFEDEQDNQFVSTHFMA